MITFDNSYAQLPERFYSRLPPEPVSSPGIIRVNAKLATQLGIDADWLASAEGLAVLAGNQVPEHADPIATVYAGHQFGSWNPQLGDGRALLLGEVLDQGGHRYDIQLKGSGRTPYSRMGDGRAPLGPVLREYIVSEAMAKLGVPTTRALAAVTTGDPVYREEAVPGAVLARVASSHIRVGTFQFFASRGDTEGLQLLANHVIERHFPDAATAENPVLSMLLQVIARQAALVAHWQLLGFIHGVMNTDNMLVSGETVDYGPCAFLDSFNPDKVFSSIDQGGRYAYRNQPGIAHWNLANLAQALLPILHESEELAMEAAQMAVDRYPDLFLRSHIRGFGRKLGLKLEGEADEILVQDLLTLLAETGSDFTLTFRRLADLATRKAPEQSVEDLYVLPEAFKPWVERWRERCSMESTSEEERQRQMYIANPVFIPRNHLIEEAIRAAEDAGELDRFNKLVDVLDQPFRFDGNLARYALPPEPEQEVRQTFCGT